MVHLRESDAEQLSIGSLNGYIKKVQNMKKVRQSIPKNIWFVLHHLTFTCLGIVHW